MGIREEEDALFTRWSTRYDSFVIDGAPNPEAFEASSIRTLIVLKDINAPEDRGKFDQRNQLATDPHPWWRTVATWCAALSQHAKDIPWSTLRGAPIKDSLASFAFIQLKKTPGGGSVSSGVLAEFARRDANEILTQIIIYKPDVIVCGGVGRLLYDVLGGREPWKCTARGVDYARLQLPNAQSPILIDYMHPSARARSNVICYGLLDAYREIVSSPTLSGRVHR